MKRESNGALEKKIHLTQKKAVLGEPRNKKDMTYRKQIAQWQKISFIISNHLKCKRVKLTK